MKVDKLTLVTVFDRTERLEAPLFQRPYVWNEERNWIPLWDSIKEVAEHKIAGRTNRPHFLGAVVMDQLRTVMAKVSARQIIDGQQRLTTLQIALAAARDLSEELNQHLSGLKGKDGLPGREISGFSDKTSPVSREQLRALGFEV